MAGCNGQIGPTATEHLKSMAVTSDSRRIPHGRVHKVPAGETNVQTDSPTVERNPRSGSGTSRPASAFKTSTGLDEFGYGFGDVALSPDGQKMAVVNFAGLPCSTSGTGKPQWTTSLPGWWGRPIKFSSDGRLLALADQNAVAIFDVSTGRRLHHDGARPLARSAPRHGRLRGDRIATGHFDGFIRVLGTPRPTS